MLYFVVVRKRRALGKCFLKTHACKERRRREVYHSYYDKTQVAPSDNEWEPGEFWDIVHGQGAGLAVVTVLTSQPVPKSRLVPKS